MADVEEVDLNPISTKPSVVKKRPRPVVAAPNNGPLIITINSVVLKGGTETYTKARLSREISIPDAIGYITNPTEANPTILAGELHGLIVKYFGELAALTIAKIVSGNGEVTEHSLVGASQADYQVNTLLT